MTEDVKNETFILSMELKLGRAFVDAFERQKQIAEGSYNPLRRKRATQVQDTVVDVSTPVLQIILVLTFIIYTQCLLMA